MNCLVFLAMAFLQSYQSNVSLTAEGKHVDSVVKLSRTMALECVYPNNASISQIEWQKEENQSKSSIAVFRLPYDLHIESNYKARILVTNFTSNNKTLIFSKATEEDAGFYRCTFHAFPDGIWEKTIHVVQSGTFEFPNLSIHHLITKPGENVTFEYRSNSDVAANRVTWERVQSDCIDFIIQCEDSEMPVYGSDYQNRVDCISASSIVLWHVTASDFGMYRFSYNKVNGENGIGWIKLMINSHAPLFTKLHMIFIGSAAFLILVIVIILIYRSCCVAKKRKRIKKMRDYKTSCRQAMDQQHIGTQTPLRDCLSSTSINPKTGLVKAQQIPGKVLLQQRIQYMSTANSLCKSELIALDINELPQPIPLIFGIRIRI